MKAQIPSGQNGEFTENVTLKGVKITRFQKDTALISDNEIPTSKAVKDYVDANIKVNKLNLISNLISYTGKAAVLNIQEEKRGGIFNLYNGIDLVDNGMVFIDGLGRKWKRQQTNNKINIQWFGAIATTNGSNNDALLLINAARDYCYTHKGSVLYIPRATDGLNYYYVSNTLNFADNNISIEGENIGASGQNDYSTLKFSFNVIGMDFNATKNQQRFVTLKNIRLNGGGGAGITYDFTKHGIQTNMNVNFENVFCNQFSGNGFHITGHGAVLGNSDRSQFINCQTSECNNGFYINGYDANTMIFNNCSGENNRRWGFYDNGFLGNNYINCNTANNAFAGVSPNLVRVNYNRVNYVAISNDDVNNTNFRPDLHPTKWQVFENGVQPAWDKTKRYYSGGAFCSVHDAAAHVYSGNYIEDYQPGSRYSTRSLILGGQQNTFTGGGNITARFNKILALSEMSFEQKLSFGNAFGSQGYLSFDRSGTAAQKFVALGADLALPHPNIKAFADGSTEMTAQNFPGKAVLSVINYTAVQDNAKALLVAQQAVNPTHTLIEASSAGVNRFVVTGDGKIKLSTYNSPTAIAGTPVANLLVDANGNVITGALSSGSSLITTNNTWRGTNTFNQNIKVVGSFGSDYHSVPLKVFVTQTKGLYFGYNTANNYGYLGAITEGQSFDNLFINPDSGSVGIGTRVIFEGEKLAVNGSVKVLGNLKTQHIIGGSATPTILAEAGAGTSGTASIIGTDIGGNVSVNIGTAPPKKTSGQFATITFATAYVSAPRSIILTNANQLAADAALVGGFFIDESSITTTGFKIYYNSRSNALAGTTVKFFYQVIQ